MVVVMTPMSSIDVIKAVRAKQFTDYLKLVEAYMLSELGIMVPVPDDLKYVMER